MYRATNSETSDKSIKLSPDYSKNIVTAAKGGGIIFIGQLFETFISLIFVITVSQLLGAEKYGLYRLTITIVIFISALCMLGMEGGIVRFVSMALNKNDGAKVRGATQTGVGIPFLTSLIISFVIILASDEIAVYIFKKEEISLLLNIAGFVIPIFILGKSLAAITVAFKKVKYDIYSRVIGFNILKILLTVLAINIGLGVKGTIIAYFLALIISVVILLFIILKFYPFISSFFKSERNIKKIIRYSIPLYLSQILAQFSGQIETMVLGSFAILVDVGIYSVIFRMSSLGRMGFQSLGRISAPIFTELHSQKKFSEFKKYYQTTTKWGLSLNLPIFISILLFSDVLLLIFGEEFIAGKTGLLLLSIGILFQAMIGNAAIAINMTGYSNIGFLNSLINLLINLTLDFLLIPRFHLIGACVATVLTLVIINMVRIIQIYILLKKMLPFNWSFLKPISAAIFAACVTFILKKILFVTNPVLQCSILLPIMIILYFITIMKLSLSEEDRFLIRKLFKR